MHVSQDTRQGSRSSHTLYNETIFGVGPRWRRTSVDLSRGEGGTFILFPSFRYFKTEKDLSSLSTPPSPSLNGSSLPFSTEVPLGLVLVVKGRRLVFPGRPSLRVDFNRHQTRSDLDLVTS